MPGDPAIEAAADAVEQDARSIYWLAEALGHRRLDDRTATRLATAAIRAYLAAQPKGATKEQMEERLP